MSIITLTYPAQTAVVAAQTFFGSMAGFLRTVVGLGVFGLLTVGTITLKPLLMSFVRATQLAVSPALAAQQRYLAERIDGANQLNQLAHDSEASQPNLAAELRYLAARG